MGLHMSKFNNEYFRVQTTSRTGLFTSEQQLIAPASSHKMCYNYTIRHLVKSLPPKCKMPRTDTIKWSKPQRSRS